MNLQQYISFFGTFVLLGLAWLACDRKTKIKWKPVVWGMILQFVFALIILRTAPGRWFFANMNDVIVKLLSFQEEGAKFLFGALGASPGSPGSLGFFFAFQVLTTIIFFSSLMSVLYYLGVMQKIVLLFAVVMKRFLGTSGAETLSASANIFVGQTEAPLIIKPYIEDMTESELFCIMVGGMATVAGGVMAAYVGMLKPYFPDIAGHLLAASVMSAPAALAIAKVMIPETGVPKTAGDMKISYVDPSYNLIDAASNGAAAGLSLALNVGTMLVAFMALLALLNFLYGGLFGVFGVQGMTIERTLGYVLSPLAWIMGVPWKDCAVIGQLMGVKTVLNEFVAYAQLGEILKANAHALEYRSIVIATYALCGFSNFLSIGIQIGGIGPLAPSRRADLAKLGLRAVLGGTLASFMTATIAGILVP